MILKFRNGVFQADANGVLVVATVIVIVLYVVWYLHDMFNPSKYLFDDLSTMETIMGIKYTTTKFINRLLDKYQNNPRVLRELTILVEKHQPWNYRENYFGKGTSYTVNKGDELYLCVKDPETGQIHDNNTLMYVTLHELAHIMTESFGHDDMTFWENFKFLLSEAVEQKIYTPIDYSKFPVRYCKMTIDDNPLFFASIKSRF